MAQKEDVPAFREGGILLGVLLLSFGLLSLEILLVRLVSILLYPVATYIVISLALLGTGISGTYLAIRTSRPDGTVAAMAGACVLFSFTTILTLVTIWFAYQSIQLVAILPVMLGLPFLFGGVAIAHALGHVALPVQRIYFADLLGAGLGVVFYVASIQALGGPGLCMIVAALGLLAAAAFSWAGGLRRSVTWAAIGVVVAVVGVVVPKPMGIIPISPKELRSMITTYPNMLWDFQGWSPVARIDVIEIPGDTLALPEVLNYKLVTQDGGAPSILLNFHDFKQADIIDHTILGIPYWIKTEPKVLIIGLGGGPDVQAALAASAREITGVEVNGEMIRIVKSVYADYTGRPYEDPRVTIIEADGRHILERSPEKYDIIQLTGVDTSVASLGGNPNLAENYLYTVESFQQYYRHLSPDGTLSISFPNVPGLGLRFVALGLAALDAEGVDQAEAHMVVSETGGFVHLLLKRSTFTRGEVETIASHFDDTMIGIYFPLYNRLFGSPEPDFFKQHRIVYAPFRENTGLYADFWQAAHEGREQSFLDSQPQNTFPPTDDWPFVFVRDRWGGDSPNLNVLVGTLAAVFVAALLFILLPLIIFRRRGVRLLGSGAKVGYFAALGLGFIFVEVVLIQKLGLFLGHPSTALVVTLSTLLISSGAGSLVSGHPVWGAWLGSESNRIRVSTLGVVIAIGVWLVVLSPLLRSLLGLALGSRIVLAVLMVAIPGFLMGIPFPTGLAMVRRSVPPSVPWVWAINSVATVAGTLLAVLIAMLAGFQAVFLVAAGCYLVAFGAGVLLVRDANQSSAQSQGAG